MGRIEDRESHEALDIADKLRIAHEGLERAAQKRRELGMGPSGLPLVDLRVNKNLQIEPSDKK